MALDELRMPTIMLWPNVDAGSEDIATGMRTFREKREAGIHPLLQELPDRDLRAADAALRLRRRQLERADPRGRVSRRAGGEHRHAAGGARPRRQRDRRRTTTGERSSTASAASSRTAAMPSDPLYGDGAGRAAHRRRPGARAAVASRSGSCSRSRSDAASSGSSPRAAARRASRARTCARWPAGRCSPTRRTPRARSRRLSRVVLSTDDPAIADAGRALGLDVPFMRPAEPCRRRHADAARACSTRSASWRAAGSCRRRGAAAADVAAAARRRTSTRPSTCSTRAAPIRWCRVVEVPHQFNPVSVMRARRRAAAAVPARGR